MLPNTLPAMQAVVDASSRMFASKVLIPFRKGGKFGFADTRGNLVVPPRYDSAFLFTEDRARVAVDDPSASMALQGKRRRYGFIDPTGREIIPLQYDMVSPFIASHELAMAHSMGDGAEWKIIDKSGADLQADADAIGWSTMSFNTDKGWRSWTSERRVLHSISTQDGKKWGYLAPDGEPSITPVYDSAALFHNGRAAVAIGKDFFYIDTSGRKIQAIKAPHGYTVSGEYVDPGIAVVKKLSDCRTSTTPGFSPDHYVSSTECVERFGYTNTLGKVVVPATFFSAETFSEGLGVVGAPFACKGTQCQIRYGYVDSNGRYAIAPQFLEAKRFSDGLAAVCFDMDSNGASAASGDALVMKATVLAAESGGCGYIGNMGYGAGTIFPAPLPPSCSPEAQCTLELGEFHDDVAFVSVKQNGNELGYYMDRAGRAYSEDK
jgi:hypothetical protein